MGDVYRLPITHHPSPITHYPSPITHHPLPITHYPSPITHYQNYTSERNLVLIVAFSVNFGRVLIRISQLNFSW
jgi:hypothetical protein